MVKEIGMRVGGPTESQVRNEMGGGVMYYGRDTVNVRGKRLKKKKQKTNIPENRTSSGKKLRNQFVQGWTPNRGVNCQLSANIV